ncbi:MAG TPA: sigma 54-interacting transcriptional regulator [Kofleriaceae bacterium]|nr:sigma 54-interacting transcriptional regulator [Kofleriaceae bacterium]
MAIVATGPSSMPTTQIIKGLPIVQGVRRFKMTVVSGPQQGCIWESSGDRCAIGSDPTNELVIEDATVSRFHCEITISKDGARVRDLGSCNGTILDGVRIESASPRGGSLIRAGHSVVRFDFVKAHNPIPVSEETRFGHLVGTSVALRTSFAVLERAAASDATVLLHGETGTGKEAAARSLHEASDRRDGPYVIVDCGAIPGNLLESELFGHERGSFTGAQERRVGAFAAAHGGTIFLDEIGELPAELQPKLLRVLESKQIRPVGVNQHQQVDVRVVAATNRDLRAEVNAGRFRSDLFYRLGVVKISLPPLRERPEDIPPLVERILASLAAPDDVKKDLSDPDFMRSLQDFAWTGNVRELRNYLERCIVMREPMPMGESEPPGDSGMRVDVGLAYTEARRQILDAFERRYIEGILQAHGGNVTRASRAAGIGRVYFYKLLNRHGLR